MIGTALMRMSAMNICIDPLCSDNACTNELSLPAPITSRLNDDDEDDEDKKS
jgi:hypothetical protein